jgi:hypothetical protein
VRCNASCVSYWNCSLWRGRFDAAGNLAREALYRGRSATGADVGAFIEGLRGPLFLRVYITGARVDTAFLRSVVRAALGARGRPARRRRGVARHPPTGT